MKNALRITLGLMTALTLMGCQKNADKQGVSVRGRSGSVSGVTTSALTGSYNTSVTSGTVAYSLALSELPASQIGTLVGVNTGLKMCGTVTPATSSSQTPLAASNAHMEVDIIDSYAQQTGQPIVTYLPFVSGYTQLINGYTYIAAEFGDSVGNIAFDGYVDPSGNLLNGRVFVNTFSSGTGLQQMGTFTMSGTSWLTSCP